MSLATIAGMADVVLLFLVAHRLFKRVSTAVVAAAFLLTTPAHFTYSGASGEDGVWVVPFVIAWWLLSAIFLETRSRAALAAAAASLAAAFYTEPAAPMLVVLLACAAVVVARSDERVTRPEIAIAAGTMALVLSPVAIRLAMHPRSYADTYGRWLLHPAYIRNPFEWLRVVTNWFNLTTWTGVFWDFFSPAHLLANASARAFAGVFLLPVGLLGISAAWSLSRGPQTAPLRAAVKLILLSAVCAVLVAASFKEPRAIQRALVIAPAGALLASYGVEQLWARHAIWARAVTASSIVAAAIQFLVFVQLH